VKTVVPQSKWIPDELFHAIQQHMPVACVDLIVLRKNKDNKIEILLIKRKIHPEIGKWCVIGGRIIKGESIKDTIERQSKEELGVSVEILKPWSEDAPLLVMSDPVSDVQKHFVGLIFPVIIKSGELNMNGPEFSEAKWFELDKVPKDLGFGLAHRREIDAFINTELKYNI